MNNVNNENRADIPQFLASLEKIVQMLNELITISPSCEQVDDVIRKQIDMLSMFSIIQFKRIEFKISTKIKGEMLTNFAQNFFGKSSNLTAYISELNQSSPDIGKKDKKIINTIAKQMKTLEQLKFDLWVDNKINQVIEKQIKILKKLPKMFPKDAPISKSFEKRIRLLK